jgi:CubicO group peptidase (beta-lactamase class C family)
MSDKSLYRHITSLLILIGFFLGSCTTATQNEGRVESRIYPLIDGWRSSTPEAQGMKSQKLIEMLKEVRENDYGIDSITIVRNGYIVADTYLQPTDINTKHQLYSVTKSFTSALVGIAIDKGYIKSVDQPILDFFPDIRIKNLDERKNRITLKHLLTMTSGIKTEDSYLYGWKGLSEMVETDDWAKYALDQPMAESPGKRFEYCNLCSHLLSVIVQKATKMSTLEFARKHLFGPLGITDVQWPTSPTGSTLGYAGIMLKPRDMARFGLLFLNKGRWNDKQIISEEWVEASTEKHVKATFTNGYGYQWWVAKGRGYYTAIGYLGQFIFVVPEKNLVAVFTSHIETDHLFSLQKELLSSYIIPAAVSSTPLPAAPRESNQLKEISTDLESGKEDIIWIEKEYGKSADGEFIRTASPAFQFNHPPRSRKTPATSYGWANGIMSLTSVDGIDVYSAIQEIPEAMALSEVGPRVIAANFEWTGSSNVTVTANEKITLRDGTAAYRTDIESNFGGKINTQVVSAYKDEKLVSLYCEFQTDPIFYNMDKTTAEYKQECASIVQSLTFDSQKLRMAKEIAKHQDD